MPEHPGERQVHTGPPLSRAFSSGPPTDEGARAARSALGFDAQRPLLLVLGGSQGAASLNRFAREHLAPRAALEPGELQVLHQAGPGRAAEGAPSSTAYRCVEYVDDVALALAAATVVLTRGGASTLAEIAALARPALVVPYPHHADRHQARNARLLGDGVRIVEEDALGAVFARELVELAGPAGAAARCAMSAALERAVPIDASERICAALLELFEKRGGTAKHA